MLIFCFIGRHTAGTADDFTPAAAGHLHHRSHGISCSLSGEENAKLLLLKSGQDRKIKPC